MWSSREFVKKTFSYNKVRKKNTLTLLLKHLDGRFTVKPSSVLECFHIFLEKKKKKQKKQKNQRKLVTLLKAESQKSISMAGCEE